MKKLDLFKKMNLVEITAEIATGKLNPVELAMAKKIQGDLEKASQPANTDTDGASQPEADKPEVVVEAVKVAKAKPNETTRTILAFTEDTKGIQTGSRVTFLQNNKPGAKTIAGKVQRIFRFTDETLNREEVKIKGDDGQRYYRFQAGIELEVVATEEASQPEVIEEVPTATEA